MVLDETWLRARATEVLRAHGARFAYVFGSRAREDGRPDSDLDVGAWFGSESPPASFDLEVPAQVDVLILDRAPLELRGRIALDGVLLFEDAPSDRVRWEATTRKIYLDELPRITRAHEEFLASVSNG